MKIDHPPFLPAHAGGPSRNDPPTSTGDDESFTTTGTAPSEGPGKSSASPAFLARQAVIDDPELANLPFGHVVSQIARGVFEASVGEGDGTPEGDGEGDDTTQSTGDTAPTDGTGDDGETTGDGETADGTGDDEGTTGDGDTDGDGTASGDTGGDTTTVSSEAADGLIAELLEELDDETEEEIT